MSSPNVTRVKTAPDLASAKTSNGQPEESVKATRVKSLASIAKAFSELLNNDEVTLDEASRILAVSKRRISDIVLALEGIGLVERAPGKKVRWKSYKHTKVLKEEIFRMEEEENELDRIIQTAEASLAVARTENAYVSSEDLKSLSHFKDGKSLFIEAEPNTQLMMMTDFKLTIKSENAPITCNVMNENGLYNIELMLSANEKDEDSHDMQIFDDIAPDVIEDLYNDDAFVFLQSEDLFLPSPSFNPEATVDQ